MILGTACLNTLNSVLWGVLGIVSDCRMKDCQLLHIHDRRPKSYFTWDVTHLGCGRRNSERSVEGRN